MTFQYLKLVYPDYYDIIIENDVEKPFFFVMAGFIFNVIIILDILLTHWKVQVLVSSLYTLAFFLFFTKN